MIFLKGSLLDYLQKKKTSNYSFVTLIGDNFMFPIAVIVVLELHDV